MSNLMKPEEQLYYAHQTERSGRVRYLHASPNRHWVELFFMSAPIVTVRLRERRADDPVSDYWGFVYTDRPDRYSLVWPSRVALYACFDDLDDVVRKGRGRAVNLIITPEAPEASS